MANLEHIGLVRSGVAALMAWRQENPLVPLDLSNSEFSGAFIRSEGVNKPDAELELRNLDLRRGDLRGDLSGADLAGSDLINGMLAGSDLSRINLESADLSGADLRFSTLHGAILKNAKLRGCNLFGADLSCSDLGNADLKGADLRAAIFRRQLMHPSPFEGVDLPTHSFGGGLNGANFEGAKFANTLLIDIDLSCAQGLDKVVHSSRSHVGLAALLNSKGEIPDLFLRGCGYDPLIQKLIVGDLRAKVDAFYEWIREDDGEVILQSCFISYSSKDKRFVDRLQTALNEGGVDYWYAPEHGRVGDRLQDQIDREIHIRDRLLVVCSRAALFHSDWVIHEIREAFEAEDARKKTSSDAEPVVFPVLLDGSLLDDLLVESSPHRELLLRMRQVLAADFRGKTKGVGFDAEVDRLLKGLVRVSGKNRREGRTGDRVPPRGTPRDIFVRFDEEPRNPGPQADG